LFWCKMVSYISLIGLYVSFDGELVEVVVCGEVVMFVVEVMFLVELIGVVGVMEVVAVFV